LLSPFLQEEMVDLIWRNDVAYRFERVHEVDEIVCQSNW